MAIIGPANNQGNYRLRSKEEPFKSSVSCLSLFAKHAQNSDSGVVPLSSRISAATRHPRGRWGERVRPQAAPVPTANLSPGKMAAGIGDGAAKTCGQDSLAAAKSFSNGHGGDSTWSWPHSLSLAAQRLLSRLTCQTSPHLLPRLIRINHQCSKRWTMIANPMVYCSRLIFVNWSIMVCSS